MATFIDIQANDSSGAEGTDAGLPTSSLPRSRPGRYLYHAANKKYVDEQVATVGGSGVPVGSIMMWMNSTARMAGSNCRASNFDINTYPQLPPIYKALINGYTSGKLPD